MTRASNTVFNIKQVPASFAQANSAFASANNVAPQVQPAFDTANTSGLYANGAFAQANAAFQSANNVAPQVQPAFDKANAAFAAANTKVSSSGGTVSGDLAVTGNLVVSGSRIDINTATVLLNDNIVTINSDLPNNIPPTENAGIEVNRGNAANVSILWNETSDSWTFTNDGTNYEVLGGGSAGSYANSAFLQANAAYSAANNVAPQVQPAFDRANDAFTYANTALTIANNVIVYGANTANTNFLSIPAGTFNQRPPNPSLGALRYNTSNNVFEVYTLYGWTPVAGALPQIISVSPTTTLANSGDQIIINGTGFAPDATVRFITSNGTILTAGVTVFSNSTYMTATLPRALVQGEDPITVRIIQNSGTFSFDKTNAIDVQAYPVFANASGSLGSIYHYERDVYPAIYVSATDPDGGAITYSVESGALPTGLSLNSSNGQIFGTAAAVGANTTSTFVVAALDSQGFKSTRSFTITVYPEQVIDLTTAQSTNWVIPTSRVKRVQLLGGGGGGPAGYQSWTSGAGGGGYIDAYDLTVSKGSTYSLVVGSGGAGRTICGGDGTPGGSTQAFGYTAGGGAGGPNGTSSAGGTVITASGLGTVLVSSVGQNGTWTGNSGGPGGNAGNTSFGGTGGGGTGNFTTGNPGGQGAGASGGNSCQNGSVGGTGGAGRIRIVY